MGEEESEEGLTTTSPLTLQPVARAPWPRRHPRGPGNICFPLMLKLKGLRMLPAPPATPCFRGTGQLPNGEEDGSAFQAL